MPMNGPEIHLCAAQKVSNQWSIDAFDEPPRCRLEKGIKLASGDHPMILGVVVGGDWTHVLNEIPYKPESLQIPYCALLVSAAASELRRSCYERGLCCYWVCGACLESF